MEKITIRLYEKPEPLAFAGGGLVSAAAEMTRQHGRAGDEILIHVNPEEFAQMQELWGEPTINPHTGLPEYGFFSKLWKKIKGVVKAVAPLALQFIPGVGTAVGGALSALGVGAKALPLVTKIATGALGGGIAGGGKGALAGALGGGLLGGAGSTIGKTLTGNTGILSSALGNSVLSGGISSALGGDFGKGALYGGLGSLALPYVNNAVAGTGIGQKLGLSEMPTLTNPGQPQVTTSPDGLDEVTVQASRSNPIPSLSSAAASVAGSPELSGIPVDPTLVNPPSVNYPAESAITPGSFLDRTFGAIANDPFKALAAIGAVASSLKRPSQPTAPTLPPEFTSKAPTYSFDRSQAPSNYDDFYTYGARPEHSFYTNNQQPKPLARGGVALNGSGGRADDIDARLSEGEYIVDAETVALLGDGSVEAGAKKLDQLRENIRRHKGKSLAKGKISPDSHEEADKYLADGGLAKKGNEHVNAQATANRLKSSYRDVLPNYGKAALGVASIGSLLGSGSSTLTKMQESNALRDARRSKIRSDYDQEIKGGSPARGNVFKSKEAQ